MAAAVTPAAPSRVRAVDILRGLACVLMAIDHVRVYAGVPAGGPTADVFFTRWITHFVAPAFCFFAGTGAFFHGRKLGDTSALARFLASRGALLVLLELTVLRTFWTFNFDFAHYNLAGVIWMLGVCMLLLATMVRFSAKAVGIFGLAVILFQQLLFLIGQRIPEGVPAVIRWLFQFLYMGGRASLTEDGPGIYILYVIVPWIGVMAAGYGFGLILTMDEAKRRRLCLRIGLGATALFLVVGSILATVQGGGEESGPWLFRLLGQQKYPASQLFLLMTLGPTIALIPVAERARGWFSNALEIFGRVPLFYYLLHIPLIHVAAIVVSLIRTGSVTPFLFGNFPVQPSQQPPGYRWSLALLYLVWFVCVVILYFKCRWYNRVKARHPGGILRFI